MNLESLCFPFDLLEEASMLKNAEKIVSDQNEEVHFLVNEDLLVKLMLRLGAIPKPSHSELRSKDVENELELNSEGLVIENESFSVALDEALLEVNRNESGNAIRIMMVWKNISLKDLGIRYGGKSGASNLANFLSKSDAELQAVKPTTLLRIASALDCTIAQLNQLIAYRIAQSSI